MIMFRLWPESIKSSLYVAVLFIFWMCLCSSNELLTSFLLVSSVWSCLIPLDCWIRSDLWFLHPAVWFLHRFRCLRPKTAFNINLDFMWLVFLCCGFGFGSDLCSLSAWLSACPRCSSSPSSWPRWRGDNRRDWNQTHTHIDERWTAWIITNLSFQACTGLVLTLGSKSMYMLCDL